MQASLGLTEAEGFNPCFNGSDSKSGFIHPIQDGCIVSILVLMEVTLKAKSAFSPFINFFSFNPCFNGSDSKRKITAKFPSNLHCFNPCFNGSDSKSRKVRSSL